MDYKLLPLYFFIGGALVTLVTYFGSQGKGLLAAFIAFFPSITVVTISTVYLTGGVEVASSYIKSLILLIPAWLIYAAVIFYLLPRIGLPLSLLSGILCYTLACWLTAKLT
jgi:uncharacterized membrane protein (GlpM family)